MSERSQMPVCVRKPLWTMTAMGVLGGYDDRIKLLGIPDPANPGKSLRGMRLNIPVPFVERLPEAVQVGIVCAFQTRGPGR